ncbi:hypothetical protein IJL65_05250 [bacterium]|nr:hypothetical protein [bacterium]
MDKSKSFSSLVAGIIIVAIAVAFLWGGAALISLGDIPLGIKLCNSFGFILFAIGVCIAIVVGGLVCFDITESIHRKKTEEAEGG